MPSDVDYQFSVVFGSLSAVAPETLIVRRNCVFDVIDRSGVGFDMRLTAKLVTKAAN